MFKFSTTLASIATLTLATVPALALATGAHAAPAVVKVSDIDFGSAHGARTLEKRINAAVQDVCDADGRTSLGTRAACAEGVRSEARDQIAQFAAQTPATHLARR
ncbi:MULTISPECIES: UrcA family protein [Phenylobacterium]|uniref:UrcA family protein n=1 Tax=Phenylobacterium koreense TaxID=266125 RepID=A0ABV2EJ63_9CAUL